MAEAGWTEPTELIIEQIEIGPMQNYTYIIGSRESREVAIVDPAANVVCLEDGVEVHEAGYYDRRTRS